jgi:G3E family GTPase
VDRAAFESAERVFVKPLPLGVWDLLERLLLGVGRPFLRVKGILDIEGEACPVAVHAVAGFLYPGVRLAGWAGKERRSRLVVISLAADHEAIQKFFSEFEQVVGDKFPLAADARP